MRRWTEATFAKAARSSTDNDEAIVWLESRSPISRSAGGATRRRAAVLLGVGLAATGLTSGSALAPIGRAVAAVEDLRLVPLPPAAVTVEDAPIFRPAIDDSRGAVTPPRGSPDDPVRVGSRDIPRALVDAIVQAADRTGVDPLYLLALADTESGFRPAVKAATSTAQGLFQFIDRTWLEIVKASGPEHGLGAEADEITLEGEKPAVADPVARERILGLRNDPYVASLMAAELLRRDGALVGFKVGRALTQTEMYLAHFLGFEDAVRFIGLRGGKRPAVAAKAFPAAARANAPLFFARTRRKPRGLTVDEVYARLDQLITPRMERFRSVEILAGNRGA